MEGISDTFHVLVDAVGGTLPSPLAAIPGDPYVLARFPTGHALRGETRLERLTASAGEIAGGFKDEEHGEPNRWARALERQCRAALDEVAYFGDVPGLDGIPTLRALAGLEEKTRDLSSSGGSSRR